MAGGSDQVARPIRIALEHWGRMKLSLHEQCMGRRKESGAALGRAIKFDPIDRDAADKDGNPLIPENSHVRLGAPAANDGAQILRRSYSYNNGLSFVAERWPPWRQGMDFDAGLLFICYQRDPRTGFIKIFDKISKFDMEPVCYPYRRRPVRLPARRGGGSIRGPAAPRVLSLDPTLPETCDGRRTSEMR